jgi:Mg2+/citrate symporter
MSALAILGCATFAAFLLLVAFTRTPVIAALVLTPVVAAVAGGLSSQFVGSLMITCGTN